jgi:hypothetical protein
LLIIGNTSRPLPVNVPDMTTAEAWRNRVEGWLDTELEIRLEFGDLIAADGFPPKLQLSCQAGFQALFQPGLPCSVLRDAEAEGNADAGLAVHGCGSGLLPAAAPRRRHG